MNLFFWGKIDQLTKNLQKVHIRSFTPCNQITISRKEIPDCLISSSEGSWIRSISEVSWLDFPNLPAASSPEFPAVSSVFLTIWRDHTCFSFMCLIFCMSLYPLEPHNRQTQFKSILFYIIVEGKIVIAKWCHTQYDRRH